MMSFIISQNMFVVIVYFKNVVASKKELKRWNEKKEQKCIFFAKRFTT